MSTTSDANQITASIQKTGRVTRSDLDQLTEWAGHYHNGQASPLYSFSSTGGTLVCNDRLSAVDYQAEVERDLRDLDKRGSKAFEYPEESRAVLTALRVFFETVCCDQDPEEHPPHTQAPADYAR